MRRNAEMGWTTPQRVQAFSVAPGGVLRVMAGVPLCVSRRDVSPGTKGQGLHMSLRPVRPRPPPIGASPAVAGQARSTEVGGVVASAGSQRQDVVDGVGAATAARAAD